MVTNSKTLLLAASLLFLSSCEDGGTSGLVSGGCNPCKIFVSATESNGNLGGLSGADAKCMSDANNPGGGTYKALIGIPSVREGIVGAQVGWVLKPNTKYTRVDGTEIQTTDGDALFPSPLKAGVSAIAVAGGIMTGLQANGLSYNHCNNWTSGASGDAVNLGVAISPDDGWVNNSASTCQVSRKFYCVQQ